MGFKIRFIPENCVACNACAVACMDQNDICVQDGMLPWRKAYQVEELADGAAHIRYISASCRHCDDAPCIDACPAGCICKDPETGFTVYDSADCTGCRSCSMACPYDAPVFRPDGKMEKCDGCNARVKNGAPPACVAVCPFDALKLEPPGCG